MFLKYFYDTALAHASYLVGCQKTGEAIVFDPGRDVSMYVEAASREGMQIVGAAETHIHADFVSGSRELVDRVEAKMYLSDEGPAEWKYLLATPSNSRLLKNGDSFHVGRVRFDVLHTPGHTPEHISFLLIDEGGGATAPMGIFTGDFVFVGSIGRPDLLETAAGIVGSAETGARQLFHSMRRFRDLPDHLQIWPAHGAGSACGKGLGAVPSSTVGYEKMYNPALQFQDEQKFVGYILSDQPETPFYFAEMKRVNKVGPALRRELPEVENLLVDGVVEAARRRLVIDTSTAADFAKGHVAGTINVPSSALVTWAGFLVDYAKPVYLITDSTKLVDNLRSLRSIGIDQVGGWFDAASVRAAKLNTETSASATPAELQQRIESGAVQLIDVRAETEFSQGHIPGAAHRFLGRLPLELGTIDKSKPVVAQCLGGGRSAIAASILQKEGYDVTNMQGGYKAWVSAGLPATVS